MDHATIEQQNLVELYVLGRLTTEEQIRFEEHFAECPQCLEQLELAQDLRSTLRAMAVEQARATLRGGLLAALARRLRGPGGWAMLGLMAALIVLPALWLAAENRRLEGDLERLRQPLAAIPTVVLTLSRDGEPTAGPTVPGAGDPAWLSLAIEVGDWDLERYRATLRGGDDQVLWRRDNLEPDAWGLLRFTFARSFLPPGDYVLTLVGQDARGREDPVGGYRFRIAP